MVALGVDADAIEARNGYVIDKVGKPPDLVLEIGTRSKGRHDYTVKRDAYPGYGVPGYWRFDHTGGGYHVSALAGDVLVDGEYRPVAWPGATARCRAWTCAGMPAICDSVTRTVVSSCLPLRNRGPPGWRRRVELRSRLQGRTMPGPRPSV